MSFAKKLAGVTAALAVMCSLTAYSGAINIKYYVLREYNNSAALFEDGKEEPVAVYSTPLSTLNAADAELIKEGIRLRGMDEVSRLLEDLDME